MFFPRSPTHYILRKWILWYIPSLQKKQPRVITSCGRSTEWHRDTGKVRKGGTHGERYERDDEQRKKVCVSLLHCVTQTVVWWAHDSPCGFNFNLTERSKFPLNWLFLLHSVSLCRPQFSYWLVKVCACNQY